MKKLKIKKRPFMLLEVMVAIFLILVCAIPVIRSYVNVHVDQNQFSRRIEWDHLAHLIHAVIVEDLYLKGAQGGNLAALLGTDFFLENLNPYTDQSKELLAQIQERLKKLNTKCKCVLSEEKRVDNLSINRKVLLFLNIVLMIEEDGREKTAEYGYNVFVRHIVTSEQVKIDQENAEKAKNEKTNKKAKIQVKTKA